MTPRRRVGVGALTAGLLAAGDRARRHGKNATSRRPSPPGTRPVHVAQATGGAGPVQARPSSAPRRLTRAVLAATAAVLSIGIGTSPAFGYFTALGGAGAGSAGTGTVQPLVILSATTGSPTTSLTPGASADLLLNVRNPNAVSVTITRVSQGGGVTATGGSGCTSDPGWPGTLGSSGVSVLTSTGLSISVAGGTTAVVHVTSGASMTTASAAGCQGATFQVPVTVVVSQ